MRVHHQKVDACSVLNATHRHAHYRDATVKRADLMRDDPEAAARRVASFCVVCYPPYGSGRIGGSSTTTVGCGVCAAVMHFPSTRTDALCLACARRLGLCKHCGSDVDLKQRRKPRNFEPPTVVTNEQ